MAALLIVEDDLKTNEAICEYLKPAGHTVIPAYDGEKALQLFRENRLHDKALFHGAAGKADHRAPAPERTNDSAAKGVLRGG